MENSGSCTTNHKTYHTDYCKDYFKDYFKDGLFNCTCSEDEGVFIKETFTQKSEVKDG